jgi:hypothetical protein
MAKVALLIGVSEYQTGLNPLPGAVQDVEAMQRVLKHPEMGGFDEVRTLPNPDPLMMQEAIEALFSGRTKTDLLLMFFSGHGVKDDSGKLYFATRLTRKNSVGELVKATAVPAGFVQDVMSNSRCKRQVIILDCCFSGAFAEGMTAKDDGTVDIRTQLGGEGRAVLTSSTSTQYSFEQQGEALSVYTRYVVEGIETGAADSDNDGFISIEELHDYARKKVQEAAPAMKPRIYVVEEGFKILLAKASVDDPKLRYRQEVESFASRGTISSIGRNTLNLRQESLGIPSEEAEAIEAEVLKPYQDYKQRLQQYEQVLAEEIKQHYPLSEESRSELKSFQAALGLRNQDVERIIARIAPQEKIKLASPENLSSVSKWAVATMAVALVAASGIGFWRMRSLTHNDSPNSVPSSDAVSSIPELTPTAPTEITPTPSESASRPSQTSPISDTPSTPDSVSQPPELRQPPDPSPAPTAPDPTPPIAPTSDLAIDTQALDLLAGESIQISDRVNENSIKRYVADVQAGQILTVESVAGEARFDLRLPGGGFPTNAVGVTFWQAQVTESGEYWINIVSDQPTDFTLRVEVSDTAQP